MIRIIESEADLAEGIDMAHPPRAALRERWWRSTGLPPLRRAPMADCRASCASSPSR